MREKELVRKYRKDERKGKTIERRKLVEKTRGRWRVQGKTIGRRKLVGGYLNSTKSLIKNPFFILNVHQNLTVCIKFIES